MKELLPEVVSLTVEILADQGVAIVTDHIMRELLPSIVCPTVEMLTDQGVAIVTDHKGIGARSSFPYLLRC